MDRYMDGDGNVETMSGLGRQEECQLCPQLRPVRFQCRSLVRNSIINVIDQLKLLALCTSLSCYRAAFTVLSVVVLSIRLYVNCKVDKAT